MSKETDRQSIYKVGEHVLLKNYPHSKGIILVEQDDDIRPECTTQWFFEYKSGLSQSTRYSMSEDEFLKIPQSTHPICLNKKY